MSRPPTDKKNGPMRTVAIRLTEADVLAILAIGDGSLTRGVRLLVAAERGRRRE